MRSDLHDEVAGLGMGRRHGGSILLYLLSRNLSLSRWPEFVNQKDDISCPGSFSPNPFAKEAALSWGDKQFANMAGTIINSLTQRIVGDRLAMEWEILPPPLRKAIMAIVNEVRGHGHRSNNVTKGIQYANQQLGGRLLARVSGPTERTLRIVGGRKVSVDKAINPARAGAEKAFAAFVRPANYANMSKAEKKELNRRLASERREWKRQGK